MSQGSNIPWHHIYFSETENEDDHGLHYPNSGQGFLLFEPEDWDYHHWSLKPGESV